jgi:hypothetical protein
MPSFVWFLFSSIILLFIERSLLSYMLKQLSKGVVSCGTFLFLLPLRILSVHRFSAQWCRKRVEKWFTRIVPKVS